MDESETLIPAFQKDAALLEDIRTASPGGDGFCLWWLGQSGFLLKWREHLLVFDPYLSDSLTRKYAETDRPHVRISERVVEPGLLTGITAATSSHNHTDHLDAFTLRPLAEANPVLPLVLPAANVPFARRRLDDAEITFIGVTEQVPVSVEPFTFHGIPAAHNEVERDELGRCLYMGFVVRFGPFAVYHSGDTLWHEGLVPALAPHAVDAALVPINGNKPERKVAGNMNGAEAAGLAREIGAKLAIPHHYDMFAFNTEPPDEFVAACDRLGQAHRVLRPGGRADVTGA